MERTVLQHYILANAFKMLTKFHNENPQMLLENKNTKQNKKLHFENNCTDSYMIM